MERSFKELLEQKTAETEAAVYAYLPEEKGFQKTIFEAMNYSVKAGGKRLRPLLMMETYRMLGGKGKEILPFMAAIEMIPVSYTHLDVYERQPLLYGGGGDAAGLR